MKLRAPKVATFLIAVFLALMGFLGYLGIPEIAGYAFWFVLGGFVILMLGVMFKGV
ncbi:MAG: hypothetical protein AAGU05_02215 [Anaerolineaceae bacterium]